MTSHTLKQQAILILQEHAQAMHTKEIARHLLNQRKVSGQTLDQLAEHLHSLFMIEIQARKEMSMIIKIDTRFALRSLIHDEMYSPLANNIESSTEQDESTVIESPQQSSSIHPQGWVNLALKLKAYPLLHQVQQLLPLLVGQRHSSIKLLYKKITQLQTQSIDPQDVEHWITHECQGQAAELAHYIWQQSGHLLNPYYFCPLYDFIIHHQFIDSTQSVIFHSNTRGQQWLNPNHSNVKDPTQNTLTIQYQIDIAEGILLLLAVIIEQGPMSIELLIEAWRKAISKEGKRKTKAWTRTALRTRLHHVQARGLIEKQQSEYLIKESGLSWLRKSGLYAPTQDHDVLQNIWDLLHKQRQQARDSVRVLLAQMPPLQFEGLICELLERMGYQNIYLTPPTHDLGIDVIAEIELGITSVKEVIQVKRQHKNIQRATLDALRGSLHRFDAVRGTLICTTDFSKGTKLAAFERAAAPITLINGEKLIDLLMTYQLGLRKTEITLWQIEANIFEENHIQRWPRFTPKFNLKD